MFPSFFTHELNKTCSTSRFGQWLLAICVSVLTTSVSAQTRLVRGVVLSEISRERIAYASISWKKAGTGRLSDSTGEFTLFSRYTLDTLVVSHVGYQTVFIPRNVNRDTGLIRVELKEKPTNEVVVNKKYNRGLLWWKKIVQHKAVNDPYQFRDFKCDMYKKLEMDLTNITKEGFKKIKLLKPFQFLLENIDSSSEKKEFLPVFMMEKVSSLWLHNDPREQRERIEAYRTSGMKNEVVLHFLEGMNQLTNVYSNSIILFGKEFISPLSDDASSYYDFKAADTQYIEGRRFLHLLFYPRRPGDNVFSGDCLIDHNSWAVSVITLEISPTANINYVNRLAIKQEFTRLENDIWVFSKNHFVAEIAPLTKNKIAVIARQTSIFQHVRINSGEAFISLVKNGGDDQVIMEDSARERTAAYWENNRPEQLSVNEQNVYKMMDTLNSMSLFQTYRNAIDFLFSGRKKLGKIEIGPWYKWVSTNQLEKVRLRFDLATTDEFSKSLRIQGYLAYGIGDNQFNGGIDIKYKFPGYGGYYAKGHYLHDLDNGGTDKGGVGLTKDNIFSQLIRKPGVQQKYFQVDEYYLGITKEWASRFSVNLFLIRGSYKTFSPLPPLKFISSNQQDIFTTEAGIDLRYAPGEKKVETSRKEFRYRANTPLFEFTYARGIPGVFGSMYQYDKIFGQVSQKIRVPRWGVVNYRVYAGKIAGGALPFMLLEIHPGNDIYYYSKHSFNLMNRFEYLSDRYAGFSVEHDFEKKLINLVPFLRKTNVRQFWNLKAVWGDLSAANKALNCKTYSGYAMQSLNGKPYLELGTGLDNIFRYFRLDLIWRISPTASVPVQGPNPYSQKPAAQFGIFGSFQMQF